MMQFIYIGIGGFLGAVARFSVSSFMGRHYPHFPFGTLLVNVIGSLLLGFISYSIIYGKDLSPDLRSLINIGFIGAFTTMSTFAFETIRITDTGQLTNALLNIAANIILCLFAVILGRFLAIILIK